MRTRKGWEINVSCSNKPFTMQPHPLTNIRKSNKKEWEQERDGREMTAVQTNTSHCSQSINWAEENDFSACGSFM